MPDTSKYLIINADDFNYTNGVSAGIIQGIKKGIITSTTVFVTEKKGPAVTVLRRMKNISVGLHFDLMNGKACAERNEIPSLCDSTGHFQRKKAAFWNRCTKREVRIELNAQINKFRQWFGKLPSHIDSHHHIHGNERIFAVLADVALRFDLPLRKKNLDRKSRRSNIAVTDFALCRFGNGSSWSASSLLAAIGSVRPGVTELIVHPGLCDRLLRKKSSLTLQRERELSWLVMPGVRAALEHNRITLINYIGLKRLRRQKKG
jgi:predicted glycoside hydrolase/deacetylase ChbG (UPF0249 family)